MCICFVFINNDLEENDSYEIIIANNRDEYFARPTKIAHFWNDDCISGLDNEPGKKGGTWFGVSTLGKIGILLNILEPRENNLKKGRGYLVSNYLCGTKSAQEYCQELNEQADDYNKFNLVLLEKKQNYWDVAHASNVDHHLSQPIEPSITGEGILAFGNSPYSKPWRKVQLGKLKFAEIIKSYNSISKKEALKKNLVELLSDRTSHWPDQQIMTQLEVADEKTEKFAACLGSIFVDASGLCQFGTRTHTLLLIDKKGVGEYVEITMDYPGDTKEWITTSTEFQLKCGKKSNVSV